jgi:hypothetical protein
VATCLFIKYKKGAYIMSKKKIVELIIIVVTAAVYVAKTVMKFLERLKKPMRKSAMCAC